jgi:hypothetical protein
VAVVYDDYHTILLSDDDSYYNNDFQHILTSNMPVPGEKPGMPAYFY